MLQGLNCKLQQKAQVILRLSAVVKKNIFYFSIACLLFSGSSPLYAKDKTTEKESKQNTETKIILDDVITDEYGRHQYSAYTIRYIETAFLSFPVAAVGVLGVLAILPESISNWDSEAMPEIRFSSLVHKWFDNVTAGPVVDEDDFFINYIGHPYSGALYYMQGRNAGLSPGGSFMISLMTSTLLWEYGLEAFAERPSIQDIISTPVVGALIGEGFYMASEHIKKNDFKLLHSKIIGYTAIVLMDPAYPLIHHTPLKYLLKRDPKKSLDQQYYSGLTVFGNQIQLSFALTM